jgi:hypothetical protein
MKSAFIGLAIFAAVTMLAGSSFGQIEGSAPFSIVGTDAAAVKKFLLQLQQAVAKDQREVVSGLVNYPMSAWAGEGNITVRNRRELVAKYNAIFTRRLQKTIAEATLETTWANWQGVMIDSGRIWFRPVEQGSNLRIITINAPAKPEGK